MAPERGPFLFVSNLNYHIRAFEFTQRSLMPRRRTPRSVREQRVAEQVRAEREEEMRVKQLPLRSGDKNPVEETTEKYLAADRRIADAATDKTEYLSREQYILRKNREVYSANGVPDASLISGLYKRTYNPEFGNRPGKTRGPDE